MNRWTRISQHRLRQKPRLHAVESLCHPLSLLIKVKRWQTAATSIPVHRLDHASSTVLLQSSARRSYTSPNYRDQRRDSEGQGCGRHDIQGGEEQEKVIEPSPLQEGSQSWRVTFARAFRPWDTLVRPELGVPAAEIRDRITAFSSHSGLLYALMCSMSVVGVMWEPPSVTLASETAELLVEAATASKDHGGILGEDDGAYRNNGGLTALLSTAVGFDVGNLLPSLTAPLLCVCSFLNLQGLTLSMTSLGRIQVIPDSQIHEFVRQNSFQLHATGLCLIPAVATQACGLVCAIHHQHGEPTTSIAITCLLGLGIGCTYNSIALALSTEHLSRQMMRQKSLLNRKGRHE